MKFITEAQMRHEYQKEPFEIYTEQPGVRLTPGARQYLLDRGVRMNDGQIRRSTVAALSEENVPIISKSFDLKQYIQTPIGKTVVGLQYLHSLLQEEKGQLPQECRPKIDRLMDQLSNLISQMLGGQG